jgi:hypothetical protein
MICMSAVMIASVIKYLTGHRAMPPARISTDARNSASRGTHASIYFELVLSACIGLLLPAVSGKSKIQKPAARASRVSQSVNQAVWMCLRPNIIFDRLQISSTEATTQHRLCHTVSQGRPLRAHTRSLWSTHRRPFPAPEGGFLKRRCW